MGLDAALDRFWEAAEARGLGIDAIEVVADNGPHGERRRIDVIRPPPMANWVTPSKAEAALAVRLVTGPGVRRRPVSATMARLLSRYATVKRVRTNEPFSRVSMTAAA